MGMAVMLLPADAEAVSVAPEVLARLARLGVTEVGLLRDRDTVAVVLEGWAFDPVRSGPQAISVLAPEQQPVRTLLPLARLSVSGTTAGGG